MLSKIDLLSKKFSRSMRGYSTEEVDLAMHEAAESLGDAAAENNRLMERICELESAPAVKETGTQLAKPSEDLSGTLAAGRKIMDEIHENAREEAQRIIEDARDEASRIKTEANLVKAGIYKEIADLRAERDAFEQKMRKLLEEHFRLLESETLLGAKKPSGDFIFAEGATAQNKA